MNQTIYKALLSDPKQAVFKSQLPDGKIAITLLVDDPELANNIVIEAKKANISVLEAGTLNKASTDDKISDAQIRINLKAKQIKEKNSK